MNALTPGWIAALAVLGLLLGLGLMRAGRCLRLRRGLSPGETVSLDRLTLTSHRLGLTGRPDRLIRQGDTIIPEEWKSSAKLWPPHRAQMGVYFLLIEDQLGVRPPHGFLITGDGTRHRVENSEELRTWVLGLAAQIREAVERPIPVSPRAGQCRACGMRPYCRQARAG